MPEFYHLDRSQTLVEGATLDLEPLPSQQVLGTFAGFPENYKKKAEELFEQHFPEGVTPHGRKYISGAESEQIVTNAGHEQYVEFVRQMHFPEKPSRFQSVFACETVEEAENFAHRFGEGGGAATIWKVSGEVGHRGDLGLVTRFGHLYLPSLTLAHMYWEGEEAVHQESLWEVLLTPPVEVVEKVSQIQIPEQAENES